MDRDIVPGVSRKVKDSRTGEEVYRIIWWQPDLCEVRARDKFVLAEIRDGNYLFAEPGAPVAAMTERKAGDKTMPIHPATGFAANLLCDRPSGHCTMGREEGPEQNVDPDRQAAAAGYCKY